MKNIHLKKNVTENTGSLLKNSLESQWNCRQHELLKKKKPSKENSEKWYNEIID